jgi:predicted GH43/DUF377 family glycosyl hydrolase
VSRSRLRIFPDPRRVVTTLFAPGEELPGGESRAASVVDRILSMDGAEVKATLDDLERQFGHRHHQLDATWSAHFRVAARRLGKSDHIPADRAQLIGAYFTREIAVESVAVLNPSMVAHPDQGDLAEGTTRFVMSLRAVSEGHVSCIEFRTGVIDVAGNIDLDEPGPFVERAHCSPGPYNRQLFHAKLAEHGSDNQAAALVLDQVGDYFDTSGLEKAIATVHHELLSRAAVRNVIERIRWVAANNYTAQFPAGTSISERVLWPHGSTEAQGMEDARFVRFVDDMGAVSYLATYTAFDQAHIIPQMLSTTDFRTFVVSQLSGPFATDKGMALFPRTVGGRFMALSRWDRENLALTVSDDGHEWTEGTTLRWPRQPWELVQVGNCGSPIETDQGWLVLTHGVGPMRSYAIGAILLDLEDPRRVIATLPGPLLEAAEDEREGYVPNVVYSCGALVHDQRLVLPYGFSDRAIGFVSVDLAELSSRWSALGS